ncbi:MFS antiporter Qdrp1 [[Candida] jaroonii]|uniref:MFS antiporter Qdrp1 n=1 Tax=[Candida] jaroonii TaxID=467808 RepID=A0ACA9YCV6_9ASCO|nr:MFS antiporter Qdrp1 [[Candida] jaroonii]
MSEINATRPNITTNESESKVSTTGLPDDANNVSENSVEDLEKQEDALYSIFDTREIYVLGIFIAMACFWSVTSSSFFYPAIPNITEEFNISVGLANLVIVIYLIFQSTSPLFISALADTYGRRPITLGLLFSFTCVSIGTSQVRVFWALAVLRSFQAISIASIISTSFGIVGDLAPRSKRGGFAGFVNGFTLIGQAFGGLLGGLLVSRWNWPGIFVFCAIGGGLTLILNFIFLPETNRTLVGNQSVTPKHFYQWCPLLLHNRFKNRLNNDTSTIMPRTKKSNVFNTLKIFFNKVVFFTILPAGLQFACWTVSQVALSTILQDSYGFDDIQSGLSYLPAGIGSILASIIGGRVLNWNYKRRKSAWNESPEPREPFNIHKVRSEFMSRLILVNIASILVFGWCIDYKVNLAPIFIASFIHSFIAVCMLSISQTLLIDLYPSQASAASSCLNLMRGLLSAIFVAAQESMMKSMTVGGTFTFLSGVIFLSLVSFKVVAYYDRKKQVREHSSEELPDENMNK